MKMNMNTLIARAIICGGTRRCACAPSSTAIERSSSARSSGQAVDPQGALAQARAPRYIADRKGWFDLHRGSFCASFRKIIPPDAASGASAIFREDDFAQDAG